MTRVLMVSLLTVAVLCVSCGSSKVPPQNIKRGSYLPQERWREGSFDAKGNRALDKMVHKIDRKGLNLHNLLAIKDGYLVADIRSDSYPSESLHDIASLTKSIMALLIGIAIDKGFIVNEEQVVGDVFKNNGYFKAEPFERIKIKHLLSMTSGLECINRSTPEHPFAETSLLELMFAENWYEHLSKSQLARVPGEKFDYNSANYHILSMIITERTGMSAGQFAKKYLFESLGISDFAWESDPHGNNYGWGNLKLTLFDLSKIAYLLSNDGKWGAQEIVSKSWLEKMFTTQSKTGWNPVFSFNYGFGWFLPQGIINGFYAGLGRGGQCI